VELLRVGIMGVGVDDDEEVEREEVVGDGDEDVEGVVPGDVVC